MNDSVKRARLEALLHRVVSRKDLPRGSRAAVLTAAPSAPRTVSEATVPTPPAPVAPAESLRTPASMAQPVGKPSALRDATPSPAVPRVERVAPPEPLEARAPSPLPAPEPATEEVYDHAPAPEISEASDVSVEIPIGSLDLLEPGPEGPLSDGHEPGPDTPCPALQEVREPLPQSPGRVVLPSPRPVEEVLTPERVEGLPLQEPAPSVSKPCIESATPQRFDPMPLPAAQRAQVVAMPPVTPTPLRELVRRSIELRIRRARRS